MQKGKKFLSDLKLHSDYLKWIEDKGRYETWEEATVNIIDSHLQKFGDKIKPYTDSALQSMQDKLVLASQRTLQYRNEQLKQHNARLYNCTTTYMARNKSFQEIFYLLLCGCGVGVSVLKPFVKNISNIKRRTNGTKTFVIPDTIEGWSDSLGVLLSSYFVDDQPFPKYAGYEIKFDYSLIRPKGSRISGGFKAPGHKSLKKSLENIEALLEQWITKEGNEIRPILAFDIVCYASNAVLSGGVRRSAASFMIDPFDEEMKGAKIGNWFSENPQRARSNNSVMLLRSTTTKEQFQEILGVNDGISDLGFVFVNSYFDVFNPCLSGDSNVIVKEGNEIFDMTMKELAELKNSTNKLPMALSMNEKTGELEWKNIENAFLTKKNANLIELELENGKTLKLTPDHKVFTENRGWVAAGKLKYDDILVSYEK